LWKIFGLLHKRVGYSSGGKKFAKSRQICFYPPSFDIFLSVSHRGFQLADGI